MRDTAAEHRVDLDAVRDAARRIAPYAHRTPVLTSRTLDRLAGRALHFKCENLQRVGAFKFRGACNAVMKLSGEEAAGGVATHSSGNHAQALALAARLRGIEAHIVMPDTAPPVKRAAVEGYGGRITPCDRTLASRERTVEAVIGRTGARFIHPYDDPDIIAGQGTCGLELLEDVPGLDALIAPIGGGGLVSGLCIAGHGVKPALRIFAAEPAGADDAARSLAAGRLIPQTDPNTIADGLLTSLSERTFAIVLEHVEAIITVTDEEIVAARRLLAQRMKLVVEPSGAVPLAAVLTERFRALEGIDRVGIVLSGGNAGDV